MYATAPTDAGEPPAAVRRGSGPTYGRGAAADARRASWPVRPVPVQRVPRLVQRSPPSRSAAFSAPYGTPDLAVRRRLHRAPQPLRPRPATAPNPSRPCGRPPLCSIPRQVTAVLHRLAKILPSTCWGLGSYPCGFHRRADRRGISPAQRRVDLWLTFIHRVWTEDSSTGGPSRCPLPAHRWPALVPNFSTPLSTVRQGDTRAHRAE